MQAGTVDLGAAFGEDRSRQTGVCVVDGFAVSLRVERGCLLIEDGIAAHRRERRYSRATHGLTRLVVIGRGGGLITLPVFEWLADVGVGFVHLDVSGRVLATSGVRGLDDARLRRAQVVAAGEAGGLTLTRHLLGVKLDGQAHIADALDPATAATIRGLAATLDETPDVEGCRQVEAAAAAVYWSAWADVPVMFARRDATRVPQHWHCFGARRSTLTGSPRRASNPANALLNYCYALAEAECVLALATVGLDPGFGWLHSDLRARDSGALDLLEAVRPHVDGYVLGLLTERVLSRREVHEMPDGTCRLLPPLTHELATTLPTWRAAAGPHAEKVAQLLADAIQRSPRQSEARTRRKGRLVVPTKLTEAHRSAARDPIRRKPRRKPAPPRLPLPACYGCGVRLERGRWCPECLAERRAENTAALTDAGQRVLAELRATGRAPAGTPEGRVRRSQVMRRRGTQRAAWAETHDTAALDVERYRAAILPTIARVPIRQLAKATGLSVGYCSQIRRGLLIPHPMHWDVLVGCGRDPQEQAAGLPSAPGSG